LLKATLKSLLSRKLRLALTALSITLGVAFIAGTFIYTDTIGKVFDGIFADAFEGIDIVVSAESDFQFGSGGYLPEDDLMGLSGVEGVASVVPFIQGMGVQIIDPVGEPVGGQGPPQFGFNWEENDTEGFVVREGQIPSGSGEVAIDAATARAFGFTLGQTIEVLTPATPVREYELVGIAGFGEADNLGGATFALFDLQTIQRLIEREGELSGASIQVVPGADVEEVIGRIVPLLGDDAVVESGQSAAEKQAAGIQEALAFFNTFLLTFGFIALFVGTFIIANTFRIVVTQRTRELALFRALGATSRQVNLMVLAEAVVVGTFASAVGIVAGIGLALALRAGLEGFGIDLPTGPLVITPRTILVGMVVGVVVTVASAILPARRASRVPPVAAMSQDLVAPRRRAHRPRALTGTIVTSLGLAALFFGLFVEIDGGLPEIAYVGLGAAVTFVGVAVLSPLIARPIAGAIGAPFARLLRVPGRLAQQNAVRSPRRTSATASALMIGIALVTLASIMAASIRAVVDEVLDVGVEADLIVRSTNDFDPTAGFTPALGVRAAADPSFSDGTRIRVGPALIDDDETFVSSFADNYTDFFPYEALEGTTTLGARGLLVDKGVAESREWALGAVVVLTFEDTGPQSFTVVGIASGPAYSGVIAMSERAYEASFGTPADAQLYVVLADGVTLEEGKAALETLAQDVPTALVQTFDELRTDAEQQINQLLGLITGLLGLAVLISLIGVTNTMTLSVIERTREIGLLRAVGMDRRQTRRMIRTEASIISIFGSLLGVVIGIFYGWAILRALESQGFTTFVVPVGSLVGWVIATGVLGIVFAFLPAWRASKLNVLEAIAYE